MSQVGILKRINSHRLYYTAVAFATLVLVVAFSALASGATLTTRSITPSSASTNAPAAGVQYQVKFTPAAAAGAVVVEFCTNTPVIGQACTAAAGTVPAVTGATASGGDAAIVGSHTTGSKLTATKTMTATEQTITFAGITNPTDDGVVYARILTYVDSAAAQTYASASPGAYIDSGSVAMSFHDTISVTGTVLETMTFCVSGALMTADCAGATAPTVVLGAETAPSSGIFALQPGTAHEGNLHTQINTNAAGGVVIHLKSSATCGGLKRAGTADCDIAAAGVEEEADVDGTEALFGVKTAATAANASGAVDPTGTLQAVGPNYGSSAFTLNYVVGGETGITSTFGDPFLNTNNEPATGKNLLLTFAAAATNNTPAGTYSTDLSMIAVGTF